VEGNRPSAEWPQRGAISFRGVTARYRPELDPVLRSVSFEVAGGQRIGVCGRTGSGKSSLMLALFRIIELEEGRVEIDGVDVASLGLDDLRSRLAIIPQEATLFAGTLRYNRDPLARCSDAELTAALEQVGLAEAARALGGLGGRIADGGENLSVGERQLVCLARALLRRARVLVLDEATANVDGATDALVQRMLREAFAGATVLVIAHRIDTIMDSDKVLVLDGGRVAEFGAPAELLANEHGAFAALVRGRGPAAAAGEVAADPGPAVE
jgi:ABC-type branched-subunit amino acid transport system ATPase component